MMRRFIAVLMLLMMGAGVAVGLQSCATQQSKAVDMPQADLIRVYKSKRQLQLLHDGQVFASYHVSLGGHPVGPKHQEGDERTPEGRYRIDWRNPKSHYYLSLHISYPDAADKAWAKKHGVSPGGAIMIHGMPNGYGWTSPILRHMDWTAGCIAVTDADMRQIWAAVPVGTPIVINP